MHSVSGDTPSTTETPLAENLRDAIDQPIFNTLIKRWVGRGELDYERYLRTSALLELQSPRAERVSNDELMFQIVHQTQELWLKLLANELVECMSFLDASQDWDASARLERARRIAENLTRELAVLESLTPDAYQVIRRHLGQGSGQESPGYNSVRLAARGLEDAIEPFLKRAGVTLINVYELDAHSGVKRILEQLLDVDEAFQSWLVAHYMLVRRTIGVDKRVNALDGVSTRILPARMTQPLFKALWDVRVEMTASWKEEPGHTPGAKRTPAEGTP